MCKAVGWVRGAMRVWRVAKKDRSEFRYGYWAIVVLL